MVCSAAVDLADTGRKGEFALGLTDVYWGGKRDHVYMLEVSPTGQMVATSFLKHYLL